ncbi:MAG: hypothetical protein KKF33_14495 [Alphaproteobacteria bacterium]|jgi:hypothetical protein|nr:hypothetical protein [Alphaproteobacteria bacterium]
MFHFTRRLMAGLPIASMLIGVADQPALLVAPPALTAVFVFVRDHLIRRRVGLSVWPSDGFARHVLVDDLGQLLGWTILSLPLFLLGHALRTMLPLS